VGTASKSSPDADVIKIQEHTEVDYGILCLKLCNCGSHLAACNDKKQLIIWEKNKSTHFQMMCTRILPRKSLSVAFLLDCSGILVADKSGDIRHFHTGSDSVASNNEKEKLLLGHLSIILDIVLCLQDRFVVSCDRDEKIRVSCYPNCYNINSFCLGHSEFVIKLDILPTQPEILISGSGDGTLRFWKIKTGKQIGIVQCINYISEFHSDSSASCDQENKLAITKFACDARNIIAVLYHRLPVAGIFKAEYLDASDTINCHFLHNLVLQSDPMDISFDSDHRLWVICSPPTETPILAYHFEDCKFSLCNEKQPDLAPCIKRINENADFFKDSINVPNLIPSLYKQWYDNVSTFLASNEERKKQKSIKRPTQKDVTKNQNKKQCIT